MLKTTRVLVQSTLWIYLAITLAFVVVTVGGVAVFGSDNLFGTYLVANSMLCIMFYLMTGVALGSIWPDLCLSMGATRRQYLAGLQITMLLGLAGYLVIMAGVGAAWQQLTASGVTDERIGFMLLRFTSRDSFLQALGMLAVFGQLGLLLGLVSQRAGRMAYIISMSVVIIFSIGLYLVVALGQAGIFSMPGPLRPVPLGCICLAIALGAGAGSAVLMRGYAV